MVTSLTVRNVNEALAVGIRMFTNNVNTRVISPRGIKTIEYIGPVATTYTRPMDRVLFCAERDANPFFHFFESMWMLAGREDLGFLTHFLPKFANYSDNGSTLHGAYGRRWFSFSQVAAVVAELKNDLNSRRAVIGIWQPQSDAGYTGKDMPCNCMVTFKVRDGELNMTVFNRSNDVVWGAYGANAVQFAFLLEYIAANVRVPPGEYVQISDSYHVYPDVEPTKTLLGMSNRIPYDCPYSMGDVEYMPMFYGDTDKDVWHDDMVKFFSWFDNKVPVKLDTNWWREVVWPLFDAHRFYKAGDLEGAYRLVDGCMAEDWRLACKQWLHRRLLKRATV